MAQRTPILSLRKQVAALTAKLAEANKLTQELGTCVDSGAYTKKLFLEQAARLLVRSDAAFFMLFDIDNMHSINETHGHVEGGDKAIKSLSAAIRKHIRPGDLFGRFGGDEFGVLISVQHDVAAKDYKTLYRKADQIRAACESDGVCTVTVGVVLVSSRQTRPTYFDRDAQPPTESAMFNNIQRAARWFERLYKSADNALMAGKTLQRNAVYFEASTNNVLEASKIWRCTDPVMQEVAPLKPAQVGRLASLASEHNNRFR